MGTFLNLVDGMLLSDIRLDYAMLAESHLKTQDLFFPRIQWDNSK